MTQSPRVFKATSDRRRGAVNGRGAANENGRRWCAGRDRERIAAQ
jgi:hypothetical protein